MNKVRYIYFAVAALLFCGQKASANHVYGIDFFYSHVSGTTYTINLVVYADCGPAPAFDSLKNAFPQISVFDDNVSTTLPAQALSLSILNPSTGIEVTPVCAAQFNNTKCSNPSSSIPGVKRFSYSSTVTLGYSSTKWRFVFDGNLGNSTAGRSSNITNISNPGSSAMQLEATLNNSGYVNSSPTYTTIPTPFFSHNKPASYNPGTIDPNGDNLTYALVPGITPSGTVNYLTGYNATQPVAATTGTFNFSTTSGQLNFTPNLIQQSIVVNKVSEYRNGVLVGTSMREMTFVILANNNNPPSGNISTITGGSALGPTTVQTCQSSGVVGFSINPTDIDGNTINVQASGVPAGASFNVTGNNTTSPQIAFSWNVSSVTAGTYTFFVTYTDNGCPLSSKQTLAYTIIVYPRPVFSFTLLAAATCNSKAAFIVTHTGLGAWKLKIYKGTTLVDSAISSLPNINDSLVPGTYTFRVSNGNDCFKDTIIVIVNPTTMKINLSLDRPTCNKFADGTITALGYNSTAPYQYALNGGGFSSNGNFTGLGAGTYMLYVKDGPGCVIDTSFVLSDSLKVNATASMTHVLCNGDATGAISLVASGANGSYKHSLNSAAPVTSGNFNNLPAGPYAIHIEDMAGCYFDTSVTLTQPLALATAITPVNIDCYGNATGSINISASGGVAPHAYSMNNAPYTASGSFNNLVKGIYFMSVKDANGCLKKDTVTLTEPAALYVNSINIIDPRCTGDANGVVMINISGGTPPFAYAANAMPFQTFHHLTGLPQGNYVVHIKDAQGCIKDSTVVLKDPVPVALNYSVAKALCYPLPTGSIALNGSGGTPPYMYALDQSGYSVKKTFERLASGEHLVRLKDDNECTLDSLIKLEDSLVIDGRIETRSITCYGLEDGEISVDPVSGFSPYRTTINGSDLTRKFRYTRLKAGNYMVTIKDTVGCRLDKLVTLTQPATLEVDSFITHSSCYGPNGTGSIRLEVAGGTKPYQYLWSTGATDTTTQLTGLRSGSYFVRVVDSNGCTDSLVATIAYADCCTPFMANAFTPNGDGKNDVFHVVSKGDMQLKEFAVFNRFGQRVFATSNISEGWDGTLNGSPADVGTYFYYVKATCGSNGEHAVDLKGDIILVR